MVIDTKPGLEAACAWCLKGAVCVGELNQFKRIQDDVRFGAQCIARFIEKRAKHYSP